MKTGVALAAISLVALGLDRLLAGLAVDTNAAAAFLSPGGASVDQALVAGVFLLVRVGGAGLVALTAAWWSAALVRAAWRAARMTI